MSTPEPTPAAPPKKINRKVVERFRWSRDNMVRLECGHTTYERGRWVRGELVLNKTARCWACEIGEPEHPAPGTETA